MTDKRVLYSMSIIIVIIASIIILAPSRQNPTDCMIAKQYYDISPNMFGGSFDTFLENRYRTFRIISSRDFMSDPMYAFAIFHPERESRHVYYEHYISKSNKLYSTKSLHISFKEWKGGRQITCNDIN